MDSKITDAQKGELIDNVKQQIQLANAQLVQDLFQVRPFAC